MSSDTCVVTEADEPQEFEEIGHSGGRITFRLLTDAEGRRKYQIQIQHQRPVRVTMVGLYALRQGIPVASIDLGGIGSRQDPPPFPGCFQVFLSSDSEGRFGHNCPTCKGYWRSEPWPNACPYCGHTSDGIQFLSEASRRFVAQYCDRLASALESETDGDIVIDMDVVADAVGREGERPPFYVSEKSQQNKFTCSACGEFNDILGRFGYCSSCRTRNDLRILCDETFVTIRQRINADETPSNCVRDAAAAMDSFLAQYGGELARHVPLSVRRRHRLLDRTYHDADEIRRTFGDWFDIAVDERIGADDWEFVRRMLLRRHVYEHNGGEVDEKYIRASNDTTVVLKQLIRETKESAHRLVSLLSKIAENVHDGFQQLVPPISEPIRGYAAEKERLAEWKRERLPPLSRPGRG